MRGKLFWTLDYLRGAVLKKHYEQIKFIIENYNSDKAKEINKQNLNALIDHVIKNVSYYGEFDSGVTIDQLPVVNKAIIKNNREAFISNDAGKKITVTTSGSTGTPFTVSQNKNKFYRNKADTLFFAEKAGYKLGSKLYYVRSWHANSKKSWWTTFLQNIVMVGIVEVTTHPEKLLLKLVKDNSNKGMISYASGLEALAEELRRGKINMNGCKLNSILAISEHLNETTKKELEAHFGMPVLSRYSNVENGIIAQQTSSSDMAFEINHASYYVEILKMDTNEPSVQDEYGRIVITDLFNYSNPLIRYDTGDIGKIGLNEEGVPILQSVEGRKLDVIYNTSGDIIPSMMIGGLFKTIPNINQFQLIQETASTYIIKLNVESNFENADEVSKTLKGILGVNAQINFEYVNEIPVLSSGKRRYVVNNYVT